VAAVDKDRVVKAAVWAVVEAKWGVSAEVKAVIAYVPNAEKLYHINRENPAIRSFVRNAKLQ
jgi:hypothetical protein